VRKIEDIKVIINFVVGVGVAAVVISYSNKKYILIFCYLRETTAPVASP
jgi:hypothetical protein